MKGNRPQDRRRERAADCKRGRSSAGTAASNFGPLTSEDMTVVWEGASRDTCRARVSSTRRRYNVGGKGRKLWIPWETRQRCI